MAIRRQPCLTNEYNASIFLVGEGCKKSELDVGGTAHPTARATYDLQVRGGGGGGGGVR